MILAKRAKLIMRCSYCGLDHEVVVRIYKLDNGQFYVDATSDSGSCDVVSFELLQ